jgi:2-iminobutanoate/2-iminopropanoate deaminase
VFVSGQLGLKPDHAEMVADTIEEQTRQVFDNLEAILTEAGSGLDRIVKTTVFLASLDDFQGMNSIYAERVGDTPPARSTIEVAGLPSGALVEIEAVALL